MKGSRYWTDYGGTPPFGEPYHENFKQCFDRLYFDLAGFEGGMAALRSALTVIRPDRLLFGTDYPYNFDLDGAAVRKYIQNIRDLDCTAQQIDKRPRASAQRQHGAIDRATHGRDVRRGFG